MEPLKYYVSTHNHDINPCSFHSRVKVNARKVRTLHKIFGCHPMWLYVALVAASSSEHSAIFHTPTTNTFTALVPSAAYGHHRPAPGTCLQNIIHRVYLRLSIILSSTKSKGTAEILYHIIVKLSCLFSLCMMVSILVWYWRCLAPLVPPWSCCSCYC